MFGKNGSGFQMRHHLKHRGCATDHITLFSSLQKFIEIEMDVVESEILGPSPPETLAATFGLKLGGRSCICRGCYLNCLSIDLSEPEEANQACAYKVDESGRCSINTEASRAGRIPKFLLEQFGGSGNKFDKAKDETKVDKHPKAESKVKVNSSQTPIASKEYSDETSFVYAKLPKSFSVDVESKCYGEITCMQDGLRHCPGSKKCSIVHEVGPKEFPEMRFLRVTSTNLEAIIEVYKFLKANRGLLCSVFNDGFVDAAAMGYYDKEGNVIEDAENETEDESQSLSLF